MKSRQRRSQRLRRLGGALLPLALFGQLPEPTFRSDVRLKEINVIAQSKDGPVRDLAKEEFQVFEDGKRREIQFFLIQQSPALAEFGPHAMGPGGGSDDSRISDAHTIILLDWINTDLQARGAGLLALRRMLAAVPPAEQIAVYVLERQIRVVHDFSSDAGAWNEAVRAVKGHADAPPDWGTRLAAQIQSLGEAYMALADIQARAELTRTALRQIRDRMAAIPGRKNLVWLGSRFVENWTAQTEGLAVYLVDVSRRSAWTAVGIHAPDESRPLPAGIARAIENSERQRFQLLAEAAKRSGGRAYSGREDWETVMREILTDGAVSYTLGYTLPEAPRPGVHRIQVRIGRKGVTLRYPDRYIVERPNTGAR